jgi:mannitol 2-dehydrogenase
MRDPPVRDLCERYIETVRLLIEEPAGIDLMAYQSTLIRRFSNPAIGDQLDRIAFDASSRIPGFVLPSARDQLARGGSVELFALVVAAWIRSLGGANDDGATIAVEDPLKEILLAHAPLHQPDPTSILDLGEVFGDDLGRNPAFCSPVRAALESLVERGCRATLMDYLGTV